MLSVIPSDLAWLRSDLMLSLLSFIPAPESKETRNRNTSDFLTRFILILLILIRDLLQEHRVMGQGGMASKVRVGLD